MLAFAALAAFVWSLFLAAAVGVALARALGPARAAGAPPAGPPPAVLLVRPCAGAEPALARALLSSAALGRVAPGAEIVFAVASEADGAFPIARRVAERLRSRGLSARTLVTRPEAPNAKSAQLAAAVEGAGAALLLFADSDVCLREGGLRELFAALEGPGVAAAWAPPVEVAPARTLGDRASQALLGGSLHAFPLLAGLDPGGLVGKLFVVRREALDEVGGFNDLTHVLGEDMELARRLRSRGLGVRACRAPASSLARGRGLGAVVERYARWVQVIRVQRRALLPSYPLLFFATPLAVLLALAAAAVRPGVAFAALGLALGARVAAAAGARRLVGRGGGALGLALDVVLADALLAAAFARALARRSVVWRGRELCPGPGGRWHLRRASGASARAMAALVALALAAQPALARPKPGEAGLNARLEDADGRALELKAFRGKPILILYEDKGSAKQNQVLKDRLAELARGDKYRGRVVLAAVADVSSYDYWPVKGFVKDAIRDESRKVGTTIYCDWDGSFRSAYGFRKGVSSVVLIDRRGYVIFSAEGVVDAEGRRKLIELLKAEVGA
ncbi:MAG TPA: glycosyltransferase [Polyangiaceae bacterium]|nr:glycosyltransferase [Polyangiaceae bacterium]